MCSATGVNYFLSKSFFEAISLHTEKRSFPCVKTRSKPKANIQPLRSLRLCVKSHHKRNKRKLKAKRKTNTHSSAKAKPQKHKEQSWQTHSLSEPCASARNLQSTSSTAFASLAPLRENEPHKVTKEHIRRSS